MAQWRVLATDPPFNAALANVCKGLFAAYNAGPGRYAAHLATGSALPGETIAYLQAVGGGAPIVAPQPVVQLRAALFAVRSEVTRRQDLPDPAPSPASLFVVRHAGR